MTKKTPTLTPTAEGVLLRTAVLEADDDGWRKVLTARAGGSNCAFHLQLPKQGGWQAYRKVKVQHSNFTSLENKGLVELTSRPSALLTYASDYYVRFTDAGWKAVEELGLAFLLRVKAYDKALAAAVKKATANQTFTVQLEQTRTVTRQQARTDEFYVVAPDAETAQKMLLDDLEAGRREFGTRWYKKMQDTEVEGSQKTVPTRVDGTDENELRHVAETTFREKNGAPEDKVEGLPELLRAWGVKGVPTFPKTKKRKLLL